MSVNSHPDSITKPVQRNHKTSLANVNKTGQWVAELLTIQQFFRLFFRDPNKTLVGPVYHFTAPTLSQLKGPNYGQ